jgi:hypothetical protein
MVYLEAFLNEVHRMCSLVPMNVYHKMATDTGRYLIDRDFYFDTENLNIYIVSLNHHDNNRAGRISSSKRLSRIYELIRRPP